MNLYFLVLTMYLNTLNTPFTVSVAEMVRQTSEVASVAQHGRRGVPCLPAMLFEGETVFF